MLLFRFLKNFHESPSLLLAEGPGLHYDDPIPDPALVLFIMSGKFLGSLDKFAVYRVLNLSFDHYGDGFVHLVTADNSGFGLPEFSFFHVVLKIDSLTNFWLFLLVFWTVY